MNRIQSLDGLRGIAVLLVLIGHLPIINFKYGTILYKTIAYLNLSYLGVDIFFVLSGYIISKIYLERQIKTINFIKNRIFRLLPALVLLLLTLLFFNKIESSHFSAALFFYSNYFFIENNAYSVIRHLWSLSVEEHFYLIYPMLFINYKKELFIGILILFVFLIFTPFELNFQYISRSTHTRILSILAGILLYKCQNRINIKSRDLLILGLISFTLMNAYRFLFIHLAYKALIRLVFGVFTSLIIVLFTLRNDNEKYFFNFRNKILTQTGIISYGRRCVLLL